MLNSTPFKKLRFEYLSAIQRFFDGLPDENGILSAHSSSLYYLHTFSHFRFGYSVTCEEVK
jgi:hypothetical protein